MGAIGDLFGGIADIETGHPLQALSHMTDALKDLPQLLQSLSGAAGGAAGAAKPAGTAAAEPTPPPARTTTSAPASPIAAPTTAAAPSASAPAVASSTPAPATRPAAPSVPAQAPTVTVTKFGNESVTRVDDGTNTTRVTEMNGHTTVRVTNDATGKVVEGYSGSNSNISLGGGGQGPYVTVTKRGAQTITRVDNGTNTATVDQVGGRTMVATRSDPRPNSSPAPSTLSSPPPTIATAPPAPSTPATTPTLPSGLGGMIAAIEKALAGSTSATAASPAAGSTVASGSTASGNAASASATGSTGSSSSASGSSSATPADLQSLMAMSPDQFMQAVTSGKIPDSVANSQSAMMQVQARMNQITQMNQLVTAMMAAMHQMQMSIIQNIRC